MLMDKLIGRNEEQRILKQFLQSKEAEFLAIYGRDVGSEKPF